eukprot:214-Heterococcus_DN1.PRE.1
MIDATSAAPMRTSFESCNPSSTAACRVGMSATLPAMRCSSALAKVRSRGCEDSAAKGHL